MAGQPLHNYQKSPIASTTSSYDSPSISSTPSSTQGGYGTGLMGTTPRPLSGQLHQMNISPLTFHGTHQSSYSSADTSPGPLGVDAASTTSSSGTPGVPPMNISGNLQAQKRAYRQRRKDPSCDACRERKVKCDATETTSCSECSSRNVKCQFTKETNRRMSSIKQLQDLDKQVTQLKRENAQLRSQMNMREGPMDIDSDGPPTSTLTLPEVGSHPKRRQRPPLPHDLSRVRANLRNYGRGIFKPPAPFRQTGSQGHFKSLRPELPPKHVSDHFLHSYYASIHTIMPILHWPSFQQEYEEVYSAHSLQRVPPVWSSLLFGVLAVGVLFSSEAGPERAYKGKSYIETSMAMTDFWNDEFNIDHARSALLMSIVLFEMNVKSAAWTWLGSSVRISQDIGLHSETGAWSPIEGEMRRRVWWGIYLWDRLISLELGRPLLIEDADCDASLPAAIDDLYINDGGILVPNGAQATTNLLLPMIHVVRSISPLIKTLKSPIITATTLTTFESHFRACTAAFPSHFQCDSSEALDPRLLPPILHLMNARIMLHRHNLSTACTLETRAIAIEQCMRAALDTTHFLTRSIQSYSPLQTQSSSHAHGLAHFGATANATLATHVWRCTLFLLFTGHYDQASICIHASLLIGSLRDVNIACGRNTAFFISTLIEKSRAGLSVTNRVNDEELMAYVSGDLQASVENSWVWTGSETGSLLNPGQGRGLRAPGGNLVRGREEVFESWTPSALSAIEMEDWGGWERVEYLVGVLAREDQAQASQRGFGLPLPSMKPQPPGGGVAPSPVQSATDRLRIRNII